MELSLRGIPFEREVALPIAYKAKHLATTNRADFVCFTSVIVELKAMTSLSGIEEAQVLNYLKAREHEVGLILNFGKESLQYQRFVFSKFVKSA